MDYSQIGLRVRSFRRKKGLSQEELAEMVNISVTHMSHIETGNTKLSLPVFVALAEALEVSTDALLHDQVTNQAAVSWEIIALLETCSPAQARCIADVVKVVRQSFDQNLV